MDSLSPFTDVPPDRPDAFPEAGFHILQNIPGEVGTQFGDFLQTTAQGPPTDTVDCRMAPIPPQATARSSGMWDSELPGIFLSCP